MLDFFISPAFAEAAPAPEGAGFMQIGLLVVMVAVFYFLLWRPQSKRTKAHKALIANLKAGDEVATASGILGIVKIVEEDTIKLQVTKSTSIKMQKAAVATIFPEGTVEF